MTALEGRWVRRAAVLLLWGGVHGGLREARSQNGRDLVAARGVGSGALTDVTPVVVADPANLRGEQVFAESFAEPLAADQGGAGVAEGLKRLGTRASLLMIVAHPDDEDGGMLTYESRGQGVRTGMLTLTRGEGGQNVMSGDFNDALGLVRTRELLAADRYLGVQQMFGTEVDFGFSKTKEEAFSQWSHERVLYDAVRAVRLFHPLVITSVFRGAATDGHGQHQVSGEMAQEVFRAAGDPKIFPEMGLAPWTPSKVYARVPFAHISGNGMFDYATNKYVPVRFENYVTGEVSAEAPRPTVVIPEGEPSALLGMSYVQFAREGLALQRTQVGSGMRVPPAGRVDVGYTRLGSRVRSGAIETSFFDGVDTSLAGMLEEAPSLAPAQAARLREQLTAVQAVVAKAGNHLDLQRPAGVMPELKVVLEQLQRCVVEVEGTSLPAGERAALLQELREKQVQANATLVAALGLRLETHLAGGALRGASPEAQMEALRLVRGGRYALEAEVRSAQGEALTLRDAQAQLPPREGSSAPRFAPMRRVESSSGAGLALALEGEVAADAAFSAPPFQREGLEQPFYQVADPALRDAPLAPPALTVWVTVEAAGVPVRLGKVVGQSVQGAYQPVVVVPPVSVSLRPEVRMVPRPATTFDVAAEATRVARLGSGTGSQEARLSLGVPTGWTTEPASVDWSAAQTGISGPFHISAPQLAAGAEVVSASVMEQGHRYVQGLALTGYPGVVRDVLFTPAKTTVRSLAIEVPKGLKVAYLPGTGDAVENSFAQIGIEAKRVTVGDLAAGRLAGYDAVVLGVRAYTAHPDLHMVTAALRRYMEAGGVVVAQYNTADFGPADTPYPLSLGPAEKVVEEDAAVRLEQPEEQILRWPNRIGPEDFQGWVEERGHGFAENWAEPFHAPTEVHDAGQDPQRGGLLVARVGRGAYVYCAYALYRQLPEGVPGAYRLLTNMVSLGHRP